MKTVEQLNAKSLFRPFGVTQFMDLTPSEFKSKLLMKKGSIKKREIKPEDVLQPKPDVVAPKSFDWRDKGAITKVKNQGQCGSCWAFSVAENVESVWILAGKADNKSLALSTQQIVDCDNSDDGCGGGDTPTAFDYIIKAGGLESESKYPYKARDGRCAFKAENVVTKISSWKYATQSNNEETMKNNLVSWAPLSICVDAAKWQWYSGGIMTKKDCGDDLDHCVQVVGYNGDGHVPYWIVRNSWGSSWGEHGYINLEFGKDTCGCAEEATTAVV